MEIRPYKDADEPAVIALWNEEGADAAPHNDPATVIRNKLSVERNLFLVAVDNGRVVGTVMGGYDGHRGWVYAVQVARSLRRRGVGSALIRRLEDLLAERGCMKVNLQSAPRTRWWWPSMSNWGMRSRSASAWASACTDATAWLLLYL